MSKDNKWLWTVNCEVDCASSTDESLLFKARFLLKRPAVVSSTHAIIAPPFEQWLFPFQVGLIWHLLDLLPRSFKRCHLHRHYQCLFGLSGLCQSKYIHFLDVWSECKKPAVVSQPIFQLRFFPLCIRRFRDNIFLLFDVCCALACLWFSFVWYCKMKSCQTFLADSRQSSLGPYPYHLVM